MGATFKMIVGGRNGSGGSPGRYPRGIEVLLKKAKVDTEFRKQLLDDPVGAAAVIGLVLQDSERRMLAGAAASTLSLMIDRTFVPRHHVGTFMSRNVPAMLALIVASTVVLQAEAEASKGIPGDEQLGRTVDAVRARIANIEDALEAHRLDRGSYPTTGEWMTTRNPLEAYLSSGSIYDFWGHKLHYQAIVKDGAVVDYCLQSWGAGISNPNDDIAGPDERHRFPMVRQLVLVDPLQTGDGRIVFRAGHQDKSQPVEWYLDEQLVGRTTGRHAIIVAPWDLSIGEHAMLVTDESGHFDLFVFRTGGSAPTVFEKVETSE